MSEFEDAARAITDCKVADQTPLASHIVYPNGRGCWLPNAVAEMLGRLRNALPEEPLREITLSEEGAKRLTGIMDAPPEPTQRLRDAMQSIKDQPITLTPAEPIGTRKTLCHVNRGDDPHSWEHMDWPIPPEHAKRAGRTVRDYRTEHRIGLSDGAEVLGISVVELSELERGVCTADMAVVFERLAREVVLPGDDFPACPKCAGPHNPLVECTGATR